MLHLKRSLKIMPGETSDKNLKSNNESKGAQSEKQKVFSNKQVASHNQKTIPNDKKAHSGREYRDI